MQKLAKKADEAITRATEESKKSRAAKEVIKSLTLQVLFVIDFHPFFVHFGMVFVACIGVFEFQDC